MRDLPDDDPMTGICNALLPSLGLWWLIWKAGEALVAVL